MTLKKTYSTEIVISAIMLFVAVAAFSWIIPFDALQKSKGLLMASGILVVFITSVSLAFLFGYFLSKNKQGEPFTFKEFNPGVTFSIKPVEKKEPDKKNFFLDDNSSQYIVCCENEVCILTDFRMIPSGDYFKDAKTGRIKQSVDLDIKKEVV